MKKPTAIHPMYGRQLEEGFPRLIFSDQLEGEFRALYNEQNLRRVRVGSLMAAAFVVALGWIDAVTLENSIATWAIVLRLAIVAPLCLLGYLGSYHPRYRENLMPIVILYALAAGLTSIVIAQYAPLPEYYTRYYANLLVITTYLYFIPGLLFRRALVSSLVIFLISVIAGIAAGHPTLGLFHGILALLAANIIGAVGCYLLEHNVRTIYLNTMVMLDLAERDGLTGMYNRRMLETRFEQIWQQARREKKPIAVLLIDVDFFKAFNDTYGHLRGDDCLRQIATHLKEIARRPLDLTGRYGGDEFVIVWFDTTQVQGVKLAKRLEARLRESAIPHAGSSVEQTVTISGGIVEAIPDINCETVTILEAADRALYQSKNNGRNRMTVSETPCPDGSKSAE